MDRDHLLKTIAETGYNVGFGAKKHFATYDIIEKMPGVIGFISIAIGIFSLVFEVLSAKVPSACLTIAGIASLYIGFYDHKKLEFESAGKELTLIFNDLRDLYRGLQGGADIDASVASLKLLEARYYSKSISNQILFSDWYAHYKFFAQQQIDWVNEQKKFTWRDKFPLSLVVTALCGGLVLIVVAAHFWPDCLSAH